VCKTYFIRNIHLIIFILLSIGCDESLPQDNVLDQDDVVCVESVGTNRICFHTNTKSIDSLKPLIIARIKEGIKEISRLIVVEDVEFRVIIFPERTIPHKGMSGASPNNEHIYILLDPHHPRLYRSLDEELIATLAHEYHHTVRRRSVGYGNNLFDSIVSEGLAEHFTIEVTQEQPPWITPIKEEEFLYWRSEAEKVWFNKKYNHLAWFIGLNSEIPRGTGYEIGRRLIADYLNIHSDKKASTLYATESKEFLPNK